MKLALRLLMALAGLALFGWFIYRAGPAEITNAFHRLGWYAPLVLLPFAIVYLFDTLGFRAAFGKNPVPPFGALMRLRWAGEAVNSVVPSAYIGGEAVKIYLLRKHGVPSLVAASSTVIGKTIQTFGQVGFITVGAIAGLTILPPGHQARYGMFAVAATGTVLVILLFLLQRRGMFTTVLGFTGKLRLRIPTVERLGLRELDDRIGNFWKTDPIHFRLSALLYFIGWICDALEVFLVSHLVGMPLTWVEALAVESFTSVAKAAGIFAPGSIGVQESGIVLLFRIFGLPEALGIPYAIIRRGREVIYAIIGMIFLHFEHTSVMTLERSVRAEAAAES
jgi:uncharacterized protein (TIRG00374 family)